MPLPLPSVRSAAADKRASMPMRFIRVRLGIEFEFELELDVVVFFELRDGLTLTVA